MDYVWFKAVWNKQWCNSGYILVPKMAILVQVEPAGILCYVGFRVHNVFWLGNWKKIHVAC